MKIICIGRNYGEHARELNNPVPEQPVLFFKPDTALLRSPADFYLPDLPSSIHYELELIVRICKEGKHLAEKFASKYYNQISVGIDFTARELQQELKTKGLPWERAKAFDGSAVVGNWIDLPENWRTLEFRLELNGKILQKGRATDMLFDVDFLVADASRVVTLKTGDVLFTGTPAGVGKVQEGDVLEGYLGDERLLVCTVH